MHAIGEAVIARPALELAKIWLVEAGPQPIAPAHLSTAEGRRTWFASSIAPETTQSHAAMATMFLRMKVLKQALVEAAVAILMPWNNVAWDEAVSVLLNPEIFRTEAEGELRLLVSE